MKRNYTNLSRLADYPTLVPNARELEMLSVAHSLALSSNCSPHKVGAILFRRNRVLARGFNRLGGHPFQHRWNQKGTTLHAEMHALILASKDREDAEGASIAVARYARNSSNGCSYPCNHCLPALEYAGIKDVICYSEDDTPVKVRLTCD